MFKYSTISGPVAVAGLTLMLALGLAACSSGGDSPPPATDTTMDDGDTTPDPAIAQQAAIDAAVAAARAAVGAVNDESTDAEVMAADDAIAAATAAIAAATDVSDAATAAATATVGDLASGLASAKSSRTLAMGGASELMGVQTAAAAAATAAMTASTGADTAAKGAEDATMNVATLQTGESAGALAMESRKYAKMAMAESMKAEAASKAAAEAETVSAATTAKDMAEAAQAAAEEAAGMAGDKAKMATDAAKTELHIDGTMKMVGESSIDATMGQLTTYGDDGKVTMVTGQTGDQPMRTVDAIDGVPFDENETPPKLSDDTDYVQAVAEGPVTIGKTLDTTDDMARLTLIHSRAGTKSVRVYVETLESATPSDIKIRTDKDGGRMAEGDTAGTFDDPDPGLRSVGTYYMAADRTDADTEAADGVLQHTDTVAAKPTGKELFSYVDVQGEDTPDDDTDDSRTTRYLVETSRTVAGGNTDVTYRHVDVDARAAPTPRGIQAVADGTSLEEIGVTADIPAAVKYDHIHFGVWASLKNNENGDNSTIADLGIGFVQNFSDSGVSTAHVTGTAVFEGDWVAIVRPMHRSVFSEANGHATLTANFSKDEFTAALDDLATLEGSLSGNTFMGTKATGIEHVALSPSGSFEGEFNGALYGEGGEEAAGVFSFDGGTAGAFAGAFGGRDMDQ